MKRGEIYRVRQVLDDPKRARAYVVVSRNLLCHSRHSTVICAPIYSTELGIETEVAVGPDEGMRYASVIRCDDLKSLVKIRLTDYVGSLSEAKLRKLDDALRIALDLD